MPHQNQITIELPMWPKELWPNSRVHWRVKARATKKYRESGYLAAIAARNLRLRDETLNLPWRSATVQSYCYFATRRRRDPDNCLASLKGGFDGLVSGGILVDDDLLTHFLKIEWDRDNPRVVITLTQQEIEEEEVT